MSGLFFEKLSSNAFNLWDKKTVEQNNAWGKPLDHAHKGMYIEFDVLLQQWEADKSAKHAMEINRLLENIPSESEDLKEFLSQMFVLIAE